MELWLRVVTTSIKSLKQSLAVRSAHQRTGDELVACLLIVTESEFKFVRSRNVQKIFNYLQEAESK